MFKKGDFTSYLLGVLTGISAALLLTLNFWGSAWWQVAIACAAGVIVGLFVADHRAMIEIVQKAAGKTVAFLRTAVECWQGKKLPQVNWEQGKEIARIALHIVGAVVRISLIGFFYSLTAAIFFVFLGHPCSYGFNILFASHLSEGVAIPLSLSLFAIFWAAVWVFPYGLDTKARGWALEKEMILKTWNLLYLFPLWCLRIFLAALVYLGMVIAAIILVMGNIAAEIRSQKKLLFVCVCIVAGTLLGTWLHSFLSKQASFLAGLSGGGIIFCAGYAADRFKIPKISEPFYWAHGWLKGIPIPKIT